MPKLQTGNVLFFDLKSKEIIIYKDRELTQTINWDDQVLERPLPQCIIEAWDAYQISSLIASFCGMKIETGPHKFNGVGYIFTENSEDEEYVQS